MASPAIVLANGAYRTSYGKTAHGLVRGSSRFRVLAVVDSSCAGADAGELLDGVKRGIPVRASLAEALARGAERPADCVVGIATHGGKPGPGVRAPPHGAAEAAP